MSSLGTVLAWKFPGVTGITTRGGAIIEWPAGQGPQPTAAQIASWRVQYNAAAQDVEAAAAIDGDKKLAALAAWAADQLGVARATARQQIIAVYKSLP